MTLGDADQKIFINTSGNRDGATNLELAKRFNFSFKDFQPFSLSGGNIMSDSRGTCYTAVGMENANIA